MIKKILFVLMLLFICSSIMPQSIILNPHQGQWFNAEGSSYFTEKASFALDIAKSDAAMKCRDAIRRAGFEQNYNVEPIFGQPREERDSSGWFRYTITISIYARHKK